MQDHTHMAHTREDNRDGEEKPRRRGKIELQTIRLTLLRLAIVLSMAAFLFLGLSEPSPAQTVNLLPLSAPTPVAAEGLIHLVYEVVIENPSDQSILVSRLEVFDADETRDLPLAAYAGRDLGDLTPFGTQRIEAGTSSGFFLWIVVEPIAVPSMLRHRITVLPDGQSANDEELLVPVSLEEPVVLGPPLRGENWVAGNISNRSRHRRALFPFDGILRIPQRFSIDWVQLGLNGRTFTGDSRQNESYHAYGAEVLAVADGVVTAVNDGVPDNIPGEGPEASAPIAGNFVLLSVDSDRSVAYVHLIPGSLRVEVGDQVQRGDVLGLVGNSGNSTEPHLHFHVAEVFDVESPSTMNASGLPFVFESFFIQGNRPVTGERQLEMPLNFAVIRFPESP